MIRIFQAFDSTSGRKVAIKTEKPDVQNSLSSLEFAIMQELTEKKLSHVPKVYEVLEDSQEEKSFLLELLGKPLS